MPVRSAAAFLEAETIILCSDFRELSALRVSLFLKELEDEVTTVKVFDGPVSLSKASGFNVLFVISGTDPQDTTQACALDTVPYGDGVLDEINATVQNLLDGFEHPDPTINATFGETTSVRSNYYHEAENWITVVVSMRAATADELNFTMTRLFDLPEATCEQNLACLDR